MIKKAKVTATLAFYFAQKYPNDMVNIGFSALAEVFCSIAR